MQAEQDAYRASLLAMPPDEILKHTWEYTAREDILDAVETGVLPEIQMQALLKSPCPLADVVKEYRDMDSHNEEILAAFEEAVKPYIEPPVYRQTFQYANEHGERDAFFASQNSYESCRDAIDESIGKHHDGLFLSSEVVQDVLRKCSVERTTNLLAYTIQQKKWDGRFSRSNKEWAQGIDTGIQASASSHLILYSHPAVLDGFVSMLRRQVLEKDKKSPAHEKPVRHQRERGDDFEL